MSDWQPKENTMSNEEIQKYKNEVNELYIKFLKDINAELRLLTQWQPIDTAPKDGTLVLICEYGCVYVAIFNKEGFCYNDEHIGFNPTHWMPLPKPPAE